MFSSERVAQKSGTCEMRANSNQAKRTAKGICGVYFQRI